jgi:NAD(P)-dependent dehydrogenase (short-subunit alcohol dehydrogenase family)
MKGRFKDKVVIVTGGSTGIGHATALTFAREEAIVVLADINVPEGEKTVNVIKESGGQALFVKTDVSKAAEVESMVDQTIRTFGRLDCAFNNTGITGETASIISCTEKNWDLVIDVNLKGIWLCLKYEITAMNKLGGGAIVNTSSILGLVATEDRPAYVASKHGIIGLTKAAALEFASKGIRVNAVCPGPTKTGSAAESRLFMEDLEFEKKKIAEIPAGRFGKAVEVSETVLWLCSESASFVTGQAIAVDGGLTAR